MEDHSKNANKCKDDEDKTKRARRSKTETDGRSYECNLCRKSYLSYPALYTHKKLKHKEDSSAVGEGITLKSKAKSKANDGTESAEETHNVSAESMEYFSALDRKGQTAQQQMPEIFFDVYNEIFSKKWYSIYKLALDLESPIHPELSSYPLYLEISKQRNQDSTHSNSSCNVKCEQVFFEYLTIVSEITNPEYFRKVAKFVFLYREFLNKHHRKLNFEGEYSSKMNAEDAPDVSNEFLIDFIGIENPTMGYTKEEAINLTQNFCRWMFNESYTTSKLSIK